jgi:hypothetical protein
MAALREEVIAQEEALHVLTMKVRTRDLKSNFEKLQQSEVDRSNLEQQRYKLQQEVAIAKNNESL